MLGKCRDSQENKGTCTLATHHFWELLLSPLKLQQFTIYLGPKGFDVLVFFSLTRKSFAFADKFTLQHMCNDTKNRTYIVVLNTV